MNAIISSIFAIPINFLMSFPTVYSKVTLFLRGKKTTQEFINTYVKPKAGDKILDIGCGPGDALQFLPEVEYFGFDMDNGYIETAKNRYGSRGSFFCKKVSIDAVEGTECFDLVITMGVIHHLNDEEAKQLFELAFQLLKPGGRLVTYDGCYLPGQSRVEKFFLDIDRGKYVRTEQAYRQLIYRNFSHVTSDIRHDLLMIPYATIVFTCTK
jgi:2-polyprenyl-3-methyl-5-hydroxy-6-metoxy-1,4-benzoquinol methylase